MVFGYLGIGVSGRLRLVGWEFWGPGKGIFREASCCPELGDSVGKRGGGGCVAYVR